MSLVVSLKKEILREVQERILKDFLDLLILSKLRKESKSGYDVITFIHKRFNILPSSGTVYSTLHLLERDGLIKGGLAQGRTVYTLTDKGKKTIHTVLASSDKIQLFFATFLGNLNE
jgi:DNA-binding PadR family transcriptional regulator